MVAVCVVRPECAKYFTPFSGTWHPICWTTLILQEYLDHVLLPHGMIVDRIEKLAADIRADLPDVTPHLLVVLKGGSEFATDLTRSMRKWHSYSGNRHLPFTVDYIRVKSYEGTESTGNGSFGGCRDGFNQARQQVCCCRSFSGKGVHNALALPSADRRVATQDREGSQIG